MVGGRAVWRVSLSAVTSNLRRVARFARKKVVAVVKADAYGHGAEAVARALEPLEEVLAFAVAHPFEGAALRRAGIRKPILVLFGFLPEEVKLVKSYRLTPVVGTHRQLQTVLNLRLPYHLNVDTGMGRCGFLVPPYDLLRRFPPEGVMTHFPSAEGDPAFTLRQIRRFYQLAKPFRGRSLFHLQNSAGLTYSVPFAGAVRVGITLYGELPSPSLKGKLPELEFPSEVWAPILSVRLLPAGSCISYGCRYRLKRDSFVGVIPFGYADGLRRPLSNRLKVFYGEREFPIVGSVTMDLAAVDFGSFRPREGERVVLVDRRRTFSDWARLLGTIPYEVMTSFGKRVVRTYER
ncbi:MAG: alanine racemase [Aquificae bacterium]|nr:alanine racemase [Aquificota bacterium]